MTRPHHLSKRRRMRIIGRDPLTAALDAAVEQGLGTRTSADRPLDRSELEAVQRVVRREFGRLVRERTAPVNGISKRDFLAELRRSELKEVPASGLRAGLARAADAPRDPEDVQERLERYERRIEKLVASLRRAENALRTMSASDARSDGIASIYRTVQGLAEDEGNVVLKRELLAKIFDANLELRRLSESRPA